MFCKTCGKEMNDGAQFCPGCGAPAQAGAQPAYQAPPVQPGYAPPPGQQQYAPPPAYGQPGPGYAPPPPKKGLSNKMLLIIIIVAAAAAALILMGVFGVFGDSKTDKPGASAEDDMDDIDDVDDMDDIDDIDNPGDADGTGDLDSWPEEIPEYPDGRFEILRDEDNLDEIAIKIKDTSVEACEEYAATLAKAGWELVMDAGPDKWYFTKGEREVILAVGGSGETVTIFLEDKYSEG